MKIKNVEEIESYIDVEKVTKDDILIFRIDISKFDNIYEELEHLIKDIKQHVLDEKEIKALFIPHNNGIEVEISNNEKEIVELINLYNKQQGTCGFKNGYTNALFAFEGNKEYDDSDETKNENYNKQYKLGYKTAWEYKQSKQNKE